MLLSPIFALLLETPKFGRDYQVTPESAGALIFLCLLAVVVMLGLALALTLIVRTCRGRPKDSSSSGRTCM